MYSLDRVFAQPLTSRVDNATIMTIVSAIVRRAPNHVPSRDGLKKLLARARARHAVIGRLASLHKKSGDRSGDGGRGRGKGWFRRIQEAARGRKGSSNPGKSGRQSSSGTPLLTEICMSWQKLRYNYAAYII